MPKIVISDTSCIIALTNIDELRLLKELYQNLITTQQVAEEFGEVLPNWIEIRNPEDQQKQKMLEFQIDKGEASAITLALEVSADLIILDDYKARQVAEKLDLKITGTLGVIIRAKNKGVISSIKPALNKLQHNNFRISEDLIKEALKESGEYGL